MKGKIEKIKTIDALDWFCKDICVKKCHNDGVKKLNCYEKMRKIIAGFEDYPVTHGQFIYSMQVKNKVCNLTDEKFKKKNDEENEKEYLMNAAEESLESSIPDKIEKQDEELEQLEQEEREKFFWRDSEMDDYDEDGVYIDTDEDDLGIDNSQIERDEETGMYKLKQ